MVPSALGVTTVHLVLVLPLPFDQPIPYALLIADALDRRGTRTSTALRRITGSMPLRRTSGDGRHQKTLDVGSGGATAVPNLLLLSSPAISSSLLPTTFLSKVTVPFSPRRYLTLLFCVNIYRFLVCVLPIPLAMATVTAHSTGRTLFAFSDNRTRDAVVCALQRGYLSARHEL